MSRFNEQKLYLLKQANELNKSKLLKRKFNDENLSTDQLKYAKQSYEDENIKRVRREPLKSIENIIQTASPIKSKQTILFKPQYDTSLNMKCYSDPDYDWILNNLESNYHPTNIENKENKLNDSFESVLTITREAKIEFKQDKSAIHPFNLFDENELELLKEIETTKNDNTSKVTTKQKSTPTVQEKADIISMIKTVKNKNPEAEEYEFAVELLKKSFKADEIQTGIFGDKNNLSRSKTQTPFDYYKVEKFKEAIANKFNFDHDKIELVWSFLRPKLNAKLISIRKIFNKSK